MDQPIHVVYISGLRNSNPLGNAAYGVWWGNDHHLNLSKILQDDENLYQAELEAVFAAIRQAREQSYRNIIINTSSEFIVSRFKNRNDRQRNGDEYLIDSKNEATINEILKEIKHVKVDFNRVGEDQTREAKDLAFEVRINKCFCNNLQQL